MKEKLENWQIRNMFFNPLAEEVFYVDIFERILNDYKAYKEHKGEVVEYKELEDAMVHIFNGAIDSIDLYLDDALYPEEMEGEDDYE